MKSNPIVVGLNPSKVKIQDGKKNSTHDRLKSWLDFWGIEKVCFTNLTGDENWDFKVSSLDLSFFSKQISGHDKVIALGTKVSSVLTKLGVDHFEMPHPSPRNRKLNCKNFEETKLKECIKYLQQ
jgi:hypothetical protein